MKYLRYTGILLGLSIVLFMVSMLVQQFADFDSGSSLGLVSVFVAALIEGLLFAKSQERLPEPAEKRAFSRVAMIVNFVIGSVALAFLIALSSEFQAPDVLIIVAIVFVIMLTLVYFVSGHFYHRGAKLYLKAENAKS